MRSCDICPGGPACAAANLAPVLERVFDLYTGGKTNKFDILFALGDDDEELLATHTVNVSRDCWTKAALLAIATVLVRHEAEADDGQWPDVVATTLATARDAYADFPWHLPDLVEQAADMHGAVEERMVRDAFSRAVSKRAFVKACKTVVYG